MIPSEFFKQAVNQTLDWFLSKRKVSLEAAGMDPNMSKIWEADLSDGKSVNIHLRVVDVYPSQLDRLSLRVRENNQETRIVLSAHRESYGIPESLTKGARPLSLEDQLTLGLWWTLTPEVLRGTNLYKSLRRRLQIHPDMLPHHLLTPAKIHFQIASDILNGISMGEG